MNRFHEGVRMLAGLVSFLACESALVGQQALGGEKTVSEFASGSLHDPEVGVGIDGSFLVAWQESSAGSRLAGRAYDADGEPRSGAFQIEVDATGDFYESGPAISFDERTGEYRASWTSYSGIDGHNRVRSRRLSTLAEPLGLELTVEGNDGGAFSSALGLSGTSRWLMAWSSVEPNGFDVASFAQVFDGEVPLDEPFRLNPEVLGYYSDVRVATDPLGNAVAVWHSDRNRDISGELMAQRVSREGVALGSGFRIAVEGVPWQFVCDVAMDSQGRFVVAWEQFDGVAEGSTNVYARRFGADGVALGEPFRVPIESAGAQYDCDLAMNREGEFVVAFVHTLGTDEADEDLYARAYRADGTPYGPPVRVDEPRQVVDRTWWAVHPSISINDAGVFVVTWEGGFSEGPQQIFARKFVLPCSGSTASLCLAGDRFRLHADWWLRDERTHDGNALPIREETGGFWFFAPDIPEVVVKILDGCGSNDHHWIYAAGLTDVEVHLSVTDTETGEIWSRVNPWQQPFSPLQDIEALGGCPVSASTSEAESGSLGWIASMAIGEKLPLKGRSQLVEGTCVPGATTLCLSGGRFEVSASFFSWTGGATPAFAESLTPESGMFWFFAPDNLELFVKIVDACVEFDRFWMFAAGLTNLEVELTVRDRWADQEETYPNALGTAFALIRDTSSFATCSAGAPRTPLL